MLYLLATLFAVVSANNELAHRRLSGVAVEDFAMEQQLLDNIAFQTGMGAYDGVYQYFGLQRRLEDDTERLNHIAAKVDVAPRRRLICFGLCVALATKVAIAVVGGIATGAATGATGAVVSHALSNSVAAPADMQQVEMMAEVAAQGAFDAVETVFGIQGVENFGDSLAQALDMHRRPACLGLCTAVVAAVAGGVASGVTGGLIGLASSISAEDLNLDMNADISQFALEQVANLEKGVMDLITEIGAEGAMNALEGMFH